ncbi:MAG: site-specific DNA-methyltransferase [Treponema sp.]|nr:site-specific DNA-methyltransferase [Treponema sp.]
MPFIDTPETNALKSKVEKLLSEIPDFVDENRNLKINVIKDCAENGNVKLLEPLLKNPQTKKAFFSPVLDSIVFSTAKFKEFLEYSSACNSYSKYLGQKIGLYMGDSSLLDRNEVVLNFPFKDCVLEGGQRKEDGLDTYYEYDDKKGEYTEKQSKRREVFYNEVLAQDEIDSLFSSKAFCNAKRYEKGKAEKCIKVNRDAELNTKRGLPEDTITDNLIIKGNNLLALHSLKKEFAGKIKLIYIDPPYNTGSDSFAYNDNFNHSSWLTFMKNRLEVARELLRYDGFIAIHCDDNEQAYLQVLLNDIFSHDNYLNTVCVKMSHLSGMKMSHKDRKIPKIKEFIHIYKRFGNPTLNEYFIAGEWQTVLDRYTKFVEKCDDDCKNWKVRNLNEKIKELNIPQDKRLDFCIENASNIFRTAVNDSFSKFPKNKYFEKIKSAQGLEKFIFNGEEVIFADAKIKVFEGKKLPAESIGDIWSDIGINNLHNEGNVQLQNGKKPEKLLERIISVFSSESDIVLDYHLGSGTTAAVAHKMNRQYIGIEQLDYGENDSVVRLQNVINGDQSGISKSVNWHGGGSFVYLELAKKNETALEQISACKSLEDLTELFDELCSKYFLHYNVRVKEFRKEIESEHFKQLSLKQQKEMFSRMLDLNQLYVNADDRHDKNTGLTKDDIAITEDFYQLKKDGE